MNRILQLHVKGIDGKTFIVSFEGANPLNERVSELKKQVKARTGIDADSQRLIYGGKQMEDQKRLCDYPPLGNGSNICLVLRLPGGGASSSTPVPDPVFKIDKRTLAPAKPEQRIIDPKLPRSHEACTITCIEDSPNEPVFVMPCDHPISPNGLIDYCWNEIERKKSKILCPLCTKEWTIDVIAKYGCASKEELHQLEISLSKNFCLHEEDIVECPSCASFCERKNKKDLCTKCVVCSRKKNKDFYFCWQCLKEWKNGYRANKCGNERCADQDQVLLEQLATAPLIKPDSLNVNIPSVRACPKCGTLIELKEGCKHMKCRSCEQEFCFVCLRKKASSGWQCGWYFNFCVPAPRQTRIIRT